MNKRPHADLIHAWADGAEIQLKTDAGWVDIGTPVFSPNSLYRIKPEIIRYRKYFYRGASGVVHVYTHNESAPASSAQIAAQGGFVSWIDNDWKTVEFNQTLDQL